MNAVFLSHASEDRQQVDELRAALISRGIPAWASSIDIKPGATWDRAIEAALEEAAAVVVLVSSHSAESNYVRAEVNRAISLQKTVIPVLLDDAPIPLRWHTLQHVTWGDRKLEDVVTAIAAGLPDQTLANIRTWLTEPEPGHEEAIKAGILDHPEWFPIEFRMAADYAYARHVSVRPGSVIDCFAGRVDSIGPRAYAYYLASPYQEPISSTGAVSSPLRALMRRVCSDLKTLTSILPRTHPLSPIEVLKSVTLGWSHFDSYADVQVYVVAGRRTHYLGATENSRRASLAAAAIPLRAIGRARVEIMSYDRLLEQARSPVTPSTRRSDRSS